MRNDRTECHACKKMIVPYVVVDQAPVRGDKRPVRSVCPFCLSEEWHGRPKKSWLAHQREEALIGLRIISPLLIFAVSAVLLVGLFMLCAKRFS